MYHLNEDITESAKRGKIEIRTLYGRYDVTLTLKMNQFQRLYPWVCAGKFRATPPEDASLKEEGNSVIKHLMKVLRQSREDSSPGVQAINERILVDADYNDPNATAPSATGSHANASNEHGPSGAEQGTSAPDEMSFNRKRQGLVREENLAVLGMIEDLLKKAETLPNGRDEFCHSLHLLRDLWKSYSSLRYQEDSFVNGNMFLAQIWLVLDCVEKYIDSEPQNYLQKHPYLADGDKKKIEGFRASRKARSDLIKSLRGSIQSISHFQKLMQSINQQSLMAPNYEVQMHTDLEKFMVAYTEYARRFLSLHFRRDGGNGKQHILPIFMMDVLSDFIKAEPFFLLPYWQNQEGLCVSNREKERLLLSIVLPDIETFGDLYATLPVICHELSHNFRVVERRDRNEALARYILSKTADYVVRLWIARISEQSAYAGLGRLRTWLSAAVADCLYQSYCEYCGEEARRDANIGAFNSNINAFLMNCFFVDTDRAKKRQSSMLAEDFITLLEQMRRLYRSSKAEWYEDYLNCVKELKELEDDETDLESMTVEAQDCAQKRFKGYQNLSEKLKSLAERMLSSVVEQRAKDVGEAAQRLGAYAANSGLNREFLKNTIQDVYSTNTSDKDIYTAVSVSAQAADKWIVDAMSKTEKVCRDLENQMESRHFQENAGLRTEERLRLLIENLRNTASESCQTIKDGNHILRVLYWSSGSEGEAIDRFHAERSVFLNRLHDRLRYDIQRMQPTRNRAADDKVKPDGETDTVNGVLYTDFLRSLWPLFCASQMREVLSPIYMDMEDQTILRRNLLGNVFQIQPQIVTTIIEENVTVYREIFADLGMCLSLNLDEFGYLMVMFHHRAFYRDVQEKDVYHSLTERMEIVCWTLSTRQDVEPRGKLLENIHTYYRQMKDYITQLSH
ncbi:MAG: hypothetical protein IJT94_15905, partial [Oscillibacter sp.]|nr:hypothetical protein [Oscillibacter sp.]